MSNKMDELFRNKLEGLEEQPSSEAWAELEQKLNAGNKTNQPVIWWSIAASVAVIAVASWMIISNKSLELDSNSIASNPEVIEPAQNIRVENDTEEAIQQIMEEQEVIASTAASSIVVKEQTIPEVAEDEIVEDKLVEEASVLVADIEQSEDPVMDEDVANHVDQIGLVPIDAVTLPTDEPILAKVELSQPSLLFETIPVTITYKAAGEVKEQKSFKEGIANVWNKAKKIKNGEEELFNIRDAKDNLLAFNFKKKKVKNSK